MKNEINFKVTEVFKNENTKKQEKAIQTILNKLIRKACINEIEDFDAQM